MRRRIDSVVQKQTAEHALRASAESERDRYRSELTKANETLSLLLTLEPALEKYRGEQVVRGFPLPAWDLTGMRAAVEFANWKALHEKYATDPVVKRDGPF